MHLYQMAGGAWFGLTGAFYDYWKALLHPDFLRPGFALLFPVLFGLALLWDKRQVIIRHANLAPQAHMATWSMLVVLAYFALTACVGNLTAAMMGPQVAEATVQHLMTTRDICVINDNSGSMKTKLVDGAKEAADDEAKATNDPTHLTVDSGTNNKFFVGQPKADEKPGEMDRVKAAQLAARYLVRHRMTGDASNTDRFCLMRFDDDVYEMAPLTTDKVAVLLRTVHITENVGGGTNFVVALKKAYDYFQNYSAPDATRVLVMNTDGYDSIDPEKRKEYIELYKAAHIKLYVIGLGEGWQPQADGKVLDLQRFAEELHAADKSSGFVFRASNPGQMQKAMEAIDAQERSQELVESVTEKREVDDAYILGAIFCALFYFGLATAASRIP